MPPKSATTSITYEDGDMQSNSTSLKVGILHIAQSSSQTRQKQIVFIDILTIREVKFGDFWQHMLCHLHLIMAKRQRVMSHSHRVARIRKERTRLGLRVP
jgi:hypothetical protein